jgi:TAG lipase/steryl ester hydrolase/phospholipase A2/LPA acyltransferase
MVWSAAVASSSLPGVFESTRLVLKEADGWERYESGGGQHFSDGSMEQDLPMQQLSEMFNVNHFIISQANPHAVMFASYNQKNSVWTSPITGLLNSILTFLKDQARAWLSNMVACIGARRLAPGAERSVGTQFFTQEYEGRPSDISLIPWLGHRSLMPFHVIYNPSGAEFREWIKLPSRKRGYIPPSKPHCWGIVAAFSASSATCRVVDKHRRQCVPKQRWATGCLASIPAPVLSTWVDLVCPTRKPAVKRPKRMRRRI